MFAFPITMFDVNNLSAPDIVLPTFTGDTTGDWTISASSTIGGNDAWESVDGVNGTIWSSDSLSIDFTTGLAQVSRTKFGFTINQEWINIENSANTFTVNQIGMRGNTPAHDFMPITFKVYVSNGGSVWDEVLNVTDASPWASASPQFWDVDTVKSGDNVGISMTAMPSGGGLNGFRIGELFVT